MSFFNLFLNFILHIDKNLALIIQNYGPLTYIFLFLVIFFEVGIVITPFLPGDSLLFAAGALSATSNLNILILFFICAVSAIFGNITNYFIGLYMGEFATNYINPKYLQRTHSFYEKYGGMTIILSRFAPIIRTFAPFVAGLGKMDKYKFTIYSVIGGILWTGLFLFAGYFFGNISFVKDNFSLVVIAIILVSLIPIILEIIKSRIKI